MGEQDSDVNINIIFLKYYQMHQINYPGVMTYARFPEGWWHSRFWSTISSQFRVE